MSTAAKKNTAVKKVFIYAALILITAVMLYPMLLMLNISLKTYTNVLRNPMKLVFSEAVTFANYKAVWGNLNFFFTSFNTLWYCIVASVVAVAVAMLAAYPISRAHFKGSKAAFTLILLSMFLPGSLVANIILMQDIFRIYGTQFSLLVIWGLGGISMNVFMLVGFIKQLPSDLDEAAWIDGCSYFKFIFVISMPLMKPIIATLFTFRFVSCWNDFLTPYIYLSDPDLGTLSTRLFVFSWGTLDYKHELTAGILMVAAPMVLLYVFMQRFIIEGLTSGALKG